MDDGSNAQMILAIFVLLLLSAFFSASETAFSSLNPFRLKSKADNGDEKAAQILALSEKYDSLLSTILIGNNIVNIGMSSLATVLFVRLLGDGSGPGIATLVITVAVLIFGEITPKSLAKESPEKFARFCAPALQMMMTLFTPINFLFGAWKKFLAGHLGSEEEGITDAELMTMVSAAQNEGELSDREGELIRSAIEFDDVEVQEVLTPRVDVTAVADNVTMDELGKIFAETGYSRLPVYHDTIDNIIGVVHEKDYFNALRKNESEPKALITPTLYTTGTTPISQLLRTLREKRHHLAVVVDEYGGTMGIVTLEDILEELVGEIWDEHDEVTQEFRRQENGSWLVSGNAKVDDLYKALDLSGNPDELDSVTVSGLVQERTNRLPKVGDRFTLAGYDGVVTRAAHRRVLEVSLTQHALPEKSEEAKNKA